MTIKSRTSDDELEEGIAGSGAYIMRLTHSQLQLIGALLHITALGRATYPQAAYELTQTIQCLMGDDDFTSDAFKSVNPKIRITDFASNNIQMFDGSEAEIRV